MNEDYGQAINQIGREISSLGTSMQNLTGLVKEAQEDIRRLNKQLFIGNGTLPLLTRLNMVESLASDNRAMHRECTAKLKVDEMYDDVEWMKDAMKEIVDDRKYKGRVLYQLKVDVPKYCIVALMTTLITLIVPSLFDHERDTWERNKGGNTTEETTYER